MNIHDYNNLKKIAIGKDVIIVFKYPEKKSINATLFEILKFGRRGNKIITSSGDFISTNIVKIALHKKDYA